MLSGAQTQDDIHKIAIIADSDNATGENLFHDSIRFLPVCRNLLRHEGLHTVHYRAWFVAVLYFSLHLQIVRMSDSLDRDPKRTKTGRAFCRSPWLHSGGGMPTGHRLLAALLSKMTVSACPLTELGQWPEASFLLSNMVR